MNLENTELKDNSSLSSNPVKYLHKIPRMCKSRDTDGRPVFPSGSRETDIGKQGD